MTTRSARWRGALAGLALMVFAVLPGCAALSGGGSTSSAGGGDTWSTPTLDRGIASDAQAPSEVAEIAPENGTAFSAQSVIQTGFLSLRVDDPRESVDLASDITRALGGRVESRHLFSDQVGNQTIVRSAQMTLRIPDERLDDAYAELTTLGTVRSDQRDAHDVTMQRVDLVARVAALERSIERLESLVTDAGDLSDLIELETALADRQADLDALTAQLDQLSDQIAFSTITVEFVSFAASDDPTPESFWSAFLAGLKSIGTALSALLVATGFALPWIILITLVVVVVTLVVRSRRRRQNEQVEQGSDGYSG